MKQLKELLYKFSEPELSKINKFKNFHVNESCYIIGDGISLKWFDLNNFSDKVSISTSLIPFHNDFATLNLKYMLLVEPYWFYPGFFTKYVSRSIHMPQISKAFRDVIKCNPDKNFILNFSNWPVLRSHNIFYLFFNLVGEQFFSDLIYYGLNPFRNSIRVAIGMAIFMGFESVYFVGCDYTHLPSRSGHWYEKGKGFFHPQVNYEKSFLSIANEYIDITTITLDGTSEFINSTTYESFTGQVPEYRENTDLLSPKYLKTLSTWHDYIIY